MILSIIVAMDENRAIGVNGGLPWRLSADLKRFRERTMGHHLIAGRKTFASIGKPLAGRQMVVVTRDHAFTATGCAVVHSLDDAIDLAQASGDNETFIIGGAELYRQTLPLADRLYLTEVHARVEADTFFPEFDPQQWIVTESLHVEADPKNQYASTFKLLMKKNDGNRQR